MLKSFFAVLLAILSVSGLAAERRSEIKITSGVHKTSHQHLPSPAQYLEKKHIPSHWNWGNVWGVTYLTKNLNQHLPVYCGSCWAHAALSALADRIKIARRGRGIEINLSIQYILNCGTSVAGSCNGGDSGATYEFIKSTGMVPFDTCLQYAACSEDSDEHLCSFANYSCSAINTCRTCNTFSRNGGFCSAISTFPNASIAEYGVISGEEAMLAEIFARGPIACNVNADPIHDYAGGIFDDISADNDTNHVVSIVGWGVDRESGKKFWIVRNSWGEYWGERGYFKIVRGENQLGIESYCAWATPERWTEQDNFPCFEDGSNCLAGVYVDPAVSPSWHLNAASAMA